MIEHIEHLTMAQFIDLACGDTGVLLSKREFVPRKKAEKAARDIIYEYRLIADSVGARQYLAQKEKEAKARITFSVFTICNNLVAGGEYSRVREIMTEYGVSTISMSDQRVAAEVKSRLERARRSIAEIEKAKDTTDIDLSELRASFDEQTASLMAHFKFQIDTTSMKAALYARLVARQGRELKAQMEVMKKK